MISWLDQLDKHLLLYLNQYHDNFWDQAMWWASGTSSWVPLYIFIISLTIWKYKRESIWVLLGIGLAILFADRFTSGFMKPFFARPRPCQSEEIGYLVHIVNNHCGGHYGFASSHAANTFGIALYFWYFLKNYFQFTWILFIWAAIISYSRVYLGVHYPFDILVGALVGCLGAMGSIVLVKRVYQHFSLKPLQ